MKKIVAVFLSLMLVILSMLSMVSGGESEFTVTVTEIMALDELEGWGQGDSEFYLWIGCSDSTGLEWQKSAEPIEAGNDFITPNSQFIFDVPDNDEEVIIIISLWEDDGGDESSLQESIDSDDDICDISGGAGGGDENDIYGSSPYLDYNLKTGTWTSQQGDEFVGDNNGYGNVTGESDGNTGDEDDCYLLFDIEQTDYDGDSLTYWEELNIYETDPTVENQRFALLVVGGFDQGNNHARYWNDLTWMYDILIENGYSDDDIFVLYADGNTPSATNCNDPVNIYDESPNDVNFNDGRHANIIDFSSTDASLQTVFTTLGNNMGDTDFLYIWTNDHGSDVDQNGNPGPANNRYLCLWNQFIRDDTFADGNHLGQITQFMQISTLMKQCFSGGFIDDLSGNNRITMTSSNAAQSSWSADTEGFYGEFTFHFHSALQGVTPDGTQVNADTNGNGYISMLEAYQFAVANDSRNEVPQLDDDGNGLSQQDGDNDDGNLAMGAYL